MMDLFISRMKEEPVFLLLLLILSSQASARFPCSTPTKKQGICTMIANCKSLQHFQFDTGSISDDELGDPCGWSKKGPLYCCPNEDKSVTPKPPAPPPTSFLANSCTNKNDPRCYYAEIPSPSKCGMVISTGIKVINGTKAKLGTIPWMVAYGYKVKPQNVKWFCGGTLITARHTLTAAHCLNKPIYDIVARLGTHDLSSDSSVDGLEPAMVDVVTYWIHPHYRELPNDNIINDIGIAVLKTPVSFSRLITPICLPLEYKMRRRSYDDRIARVAGWGATEYGNGNSYPDQLMEAEVEVYKHITCANIYRNNLGPGKRVDIMTTQLCAGGKSSDACQGDSGGPLMYEQKNQQYLIGIVSTGYKCAVPGVPGIYTRVTRYLDWIDENVAIKEDSSEEDSDESD